MAGFEVTIEEMNREDRFSASELNVVFEVGSCRSKGTLDNRLAQPYQLKSLQDRLSVSTGRRFVDDAPPEEINQKEE